MKRESKKTRERQSTSLLLKAFLLLAMIMTGGNAWGQTSLGKVEIGSSVEANNSGWQKFGSDGIIKEAWIIGTAEIKNPAGYYVKLTSEGKIKLRFSPSNLHAGDILKVNVGPSGDNSENLGYIVEGSNTFVEAGQKTGDDKYTMAQDIEYTLKANDIQQDPDDSNFVMVVINRSGGGHAYAYHSLEIVRPDGFVVIYAPNNPDWGTVTATVNGNPITSGSLVAPNTKVTFTATPKSSEYLTWGWAGDASDYAAQTEVTVTKDINVTHNFTPGIKINAYPNNGSLGSINITGGGKSGTNIHITPWAGPVTFTATPIAGATFDGWYTDVDCTDLATDQLTLTYNNDDNIKISTGTMKLTGTGTINRWAKFKKDLHPDVNCNNTTIDLTKAENFGNTTYNSATGELVVTDYNQYGNGLTIEFNNPQNMSHVKTITINGAEFKNPFFDRMSGETIWVSHAESANKTVLNLSGRTDCDNIKKITLRDIQAGTYTISSIVLEYDHTPAMPNFINGTTSEMTIYESDDLVLSVDNALNTYWREYKDENYRWDQQVTTHIPTNEWNTPIRTISGLTEASSPYYFAAERGNNCEFGQWHVSDKNTVKVKVLSAPTNLKVTYDLNAPSGNPAKGTAPVDNNSYNYKAEANIMAPGSISREGYFFAYWSTNPDGSGTRYSNKSEDGEVKIVVKDNTTLYAIWNKEGFEGFFNFENRLIAQWNIDLADGARLHEGSMANDTWTQTTDGNKTTFTLSKAISSGELVYGGSNSTVKIPVFAGLKFTAAANQIKIVVTKNGSEIENTQLVVAKDVQMEVPYVRNSYRDDGGNDQSPYGWNDKFIAAGTDWGGKHYDKDTWGVVYHNEFRPARFNAMQDCLHHINRDIVYIVCNPTVWDHYGKTSGAITNKCHDDNDKILFNNGGDEDVHGLRNGEKKVWEKLNFTGNQGKPCIITFAKETTIDRIGVNRNLTYSYYTENIAATSEGKYTKPFPGLRIIGSPRGAKVADVGDTYATYNNAIAMTYGGWPHNGNEYKDGSNNTITDTWGNLTVYYGKDQGEGTNSYDSSQFTSIDVTKVPVATDGFPVYSRETSHAYSENVNPASKSDEGGSIVYHDQSYGEFLLHQDDGGSNEKPYLDNFNPWTLPCRGAYVKFEPTLPGVLNVHILQEASADYYIADEFGRLVKNNVFVKAGTASTTVTNTNGHFSINQKDNVKYSFDVYPGKTYYLFSSTAGMGVTGFNFEPYVYRKYNTLAAAGDNHEEYELARQDVGIKTATMSAGPVFTFSDATYDYTNQTAEYHGGTQTNLNEDDGSQIMKDDGVTPDVEKYAAISKTAAGSYNNSVNPLIYDNKAVHVTLDRSFTAGKWSTIVLPYSMNNLQLETVFGEGTKVVLLRDVQLYDPAQGGKTTAYFVYHMNQDIIAGYPYLILPTKTISRVETNAYVYNTATDNKFNSSLTDYSAPSIVDISGEGPNLVTYNGPTYGGMGAYTFKSTYKGDTEMPKGSYVMSNNKLTRLPKAQTSDAFKAFLSYNGGEYFAKDYAINAVSFGDLEDELADVDAIEDILLESGIIGAKTDIYNINGQIVRQHTDDLNGLPKGMYIVNGKKYIVK